MAYRLLLVSGDTEGNVAAPLDVRIIL